MGYPQREGQTNDRNSGHFMSHTFKLGTIITALGAHMSVISSGTLSYCKREDIFERQSPQIYENAPPTTEALLGVVYCTIDQLERHTFYLIKNDVGN